MKPRLNTWTLGGLIVGPVLGSGIILLPPLAYDRLGDQSVWAWLIILALGVGFAAVFIAMTLRTHSDSGIASLVARERGATWGALASNFLTGAVVFGAVPVLLTAAQLWPAPWSLGLPTVILAAIFLVITVGLLLAGLTTISGLTLTLSLVTAALLLVGSSVALLTAPKIVLPLPEFSLPNLGQTLLLLFWAIVGWEVVANYSKEVRDPGRTIPRAAAVSLVLVTLVYLAVSVTLQTLAPTATRPVTMALVLTPLLGALAGPVTGVLATGLCLCTILMFTGAVTRMTFQRARGGELPGWLGRGNPAHAPVVPILVLGGTSTAFLCLVGLKWVDLSFLVSLANLFFLGNALLGLSAAWSILNRGAWRPLVVLLAILLAVLISQGNPVGWIAVAVVAGLSFLRR